MSTLRINNIEAQSIPASPTIDEKVKVTNSSGDILVNIDGKTSGITTIGINTTDGNIKFDANSNVLITGILTATTLSGNFTPTSLEIGSNIKLGNAGVITATSFVGSGANLTGITQTTINNNATTKFITGTNNANELDCEANLSYNNSTVTFSSSNLLIDKSTNPTIIAKETAGNKEVQLRANTTGGLLRTAGSYPLALGTNQTERLRINSNGQVRIGGSISASPQCDLDVVRANSTLTDVMLIKGNVGNGFIRFQDNDNSCNFTLGADDGAGLGANSFILYDRVNSAYRFGVDNSGNFKVHSGNIVIGTAGKGIDFSATSDASGSSSELLDDYEEGSYSPTLTGSGGGSFGLNPHALRYTKVGRVVHVSGRLYIHSSSGLSGSEVRMTLPYANSSAISSQDAHSYSHVTTYNAYNPNSDYQMVFSVLPGNSYGIFLWVVPNAAWQSVSPTSHMNQNAAYYGFDFSYTTAT